MTTATVARLPKGCWSLKPGLPGNKWTTLSHKFEARRHVLFTVTRVFARVHSRLTPAGKMAGVAPGEIRITLFIAELGLPILGRSGGLYESVRIAGSSFFGQ